MQPIGHFPAAAREVRTRLHTSMSMQGACDG
jgi:hypothetical protein